jgi:thymidylate synthase
MMWMLHGRTHEDELRAHGVDIWKEWATEEKTARFGRAEFDLGPIYGWQWRRFGAGYDHNDNPGLFVDGGHEVPAHDGVDQLQWLLDQIRDNPNSRRLLVSLWNPMQQDKVELPPCHSFVQFKVHSVRSGRPVALSCMMYMRSVDVFLGLPFDIAHYAMLTHLLAHATGLTARHLVVSMADTHIYNNHVEAVEEQLQRSPGELPYLGLENVPRRDTPLNTVLLARWEDVKVQGYKPQGSIKAEVAV